MMSNWARARAVFANGDNKYAHGTLRRSVHVGYESAGGSGILIKISSLDKSKSRILTANQRGTSLSN